MRSSAPDPRCRSPLTPAVRPELYEVAGKQGEPLRVVMLLPGVTTPLRGISYPIVRGQ